jgi:hypothetical protein
LIDSDLNPEGVNPLTFEEHRELAAELRRSKARLLQLASMVASLYGRQNLAAFAFQKLNESLDRLFLELEAQAEADCPGLNAASLYR